jgi:hypothetical protein
MGGKPKRGPSYYNSVARQRRLHRLSWVPSTSLVCHDRGVEEPPMAIVEEEILAEPVNILSASLLYTVLDPQDLPLIGYFIPGAVGVSDWATCIIKEEISLEEGHEETIPPISNAPEQDSCSTCYLSPKHLDLIFEMRRDMLEQLHMHTLLNNHLDLLYDALSGSQSQ